MQRQPKFECDVQEKKSSARTDRRLGALAPQVDVGEADRVPVAEDRVLLLGERCGIKTN